jgi:hypothetical protein
MKNHPIAILVLTAAFLLSACGGDPAGQKAGADLKPAAGPQAAAATAAVAGPPPAAKPAGAKPPDGKVAAQVPSEPPPPLAVPPGYSYQPRGRRDPFVNPLPKTPEGSVEDKVVIRPDGLPGVLVSEVKLSGIIYSPVQTMKKAMLVVGRSTYFARQGDSLFDGVIKEIRPNEVVFAMVSTTTKQPINRETVMRTGGSSVTLAGEKK